MKKLFIDALFKKYREDLKTRLLKKDITLLDIIKIKYLLIRKNKERGKTI